MESSQDGKPASHCMEQVPPYRRVVCSTLGGSPHIGLPRFWKSFLCRGNLSHYHICCSVNSETEGEKALAYKLMGVSGDSSVK